MSIELLRQMVDTLGLQEVSRRIGKDKTTVCHVLRGTYNGRPDRILKLVREKFSEERILCPILGELTLSECVEQKNMAPNTDNPVNVMLARTCPRCERGNR